VLVGLVLVGLVLVGLMLVGLVLVGLGNLLSAVGGALTPALGHLWSVDLEWQFYLVGRCLPSRCGDVSFRW
jgi:peptidoglycan/LPS O-acetylase OafA/YrhL